MIYGVGVVAEVTAGPLSRDDLQLWHQVVRVGPARMYTHRAVRNWSASAVSDHSVGTSAHRTFTAELDPQSLRAECRGSLVQRTNLIKSQQVPRWLA